MKNVAVLMEDGAFALFFRPHPREFAIQGKKNANARTGADRNRFPPFYENGSEFS